MKKLLIIEDDTALREGLERALAGEEWSVLSAASLAEAKLRIADVPDLVLLDCNLPDGNGVDFCRACLRETGIPVIFLTVRDSELDEVAAFRAGCVDYIKKPFSVMVLRERIRSAMERGKAAGNGYSDGVYRFQFDEMRYFMGDTELYFGGTEQKLLRALVDNRRQVMTREVLLDHVWGFDGELVDPGVLSVTIKRLRDKLGENAILTVYGLGYKWNGSRKRGEDI